MDWLKNTSSCCSEKWREGGLEPPKRPPDIHDHGACLCHLIRYTNIVNFQIDHGWAETFLLLLSFLENTRQCHQICRKATYRIWLYIGNIYFSIFVMVHICLNCCGLHCIGNPRVCKLIKVYRGDPSFGLNDWRVAIRGFKEFYTWNMTSSFGLVLALNWCHNS